LSAISRGTRRADHPEAKWIPGPSPSAGTSRAVESRLPLRRPVSTSTQVESRKRPTKATAKPGDVAHCIQSRTIPTSATLIAAAPDRSSDRAPRALGSRACRAWRLPCQPLPICRQAAQPPSRPQVRSRRTLRRKEKSSMQPRPSSAGAAASDGKLTTLIARGGKGAAACRHGSPATTSVSYPPAADAR